MTGAVPLSFAVVFVCLLGVLGITEVDALGIDFFVPSVGGPLTVVVGVGVVVVGGVGVVVGEMVVVAVVEAAIVGKVTTASAGEGGMLLMAVRIAVGVVLSGGRLLEIFNLEPETLSFFFASFSSRDINKGLACMLFVVC